MGSVVISVEVGPGWGRHPDDGASDERYREARDAWRRASYLFDRYEVPATWLLAGHLFAPGSRNGPSGEHDGTRATRRARRRSRAGSPERSSEGVSSNEERRGSSDGKSGGVSSNEGRPDEGSASDRGGASQDSGDESNGSPCVHPDHPEDAAQFPGDSTVDRTQSAWFVSDLIEGLRRSPVAHEIGCQSFSRIDFSDASQDDAAAEVRASIDAAAERGVGTEQLRSFAFPDGRAGHRDVLLAYGFECYCEPESRSGGPLSSLPTVLGLFVRRLTGAGPPLVEPETDEHGLVAVPTSLSLFPLAGRARSAARVGRGDLVVELAKRGLERAGKSDGILHLWFAPTDLRTGADFDRLEAVLSHVADCRDETQLAVETMGQVARRVGDLAAMPPATIR